MRLHESFFLELFESHIGEIVDALGPGVFSHVVVANAHESLCEDLEPVIRLGGVGGVILFVDLFGDGFVKETFSVEEIPVLDVEVDVAEADCE